MPPPDASVAHYQRQAVLTARVLGQAQPMWEQASRNLDAQWPSTGPRLLALTTAGQTAAAADSIASIPPVLTELGMAPTPAVGTVPAAAYAGTASDGRPLASLLYEPAITTYTALGSGVDAAQAREAGWNALATILRTQLADAARTAAGVSITARPRVQGWVRMLQLPSCSRCVTLAGRFYRWSAGFDRHPRCDCRHIPANEDTAGDLTTDPMAAYRSGQVTGLSRAEQQAIDDGADFSAVVNSHRGGITTANVYGRQVKTTTEGVTRRGSAGDRVDYRRTARLTPESIYDLAGDDRNEAIQLLRRFGYIL